MWSNNEKDCSDQESQLTEFITFIAFISSSDIFYFSSNVMRILEWIVTPRDANYGGFCPLYFCKSQSGVYLESCWRRAGAAQKPGHSHGSLGLLTRRQILMILTCAPLTSVKI